MVVANRPLLTLYTGTGMCADRLRIKLLVRLIRKERVISVRPSDPTSVVERGRLI